MIDTSNPHSLDAAFVEHPEQRESFTIMLLANGREGEGIGAHVGRTWAGVVVVADGDIIYSTGPGHGYKSAYSMVQAFIHTWRLRGYER